ncbi:MAG: hypothetical protein D3906_13575, partial [Candidatus Electrothrix sp. AUS1_2]|nr:hypothetical protein [Candidatus Electrothrix sp. AUS1_2]
MRKVTRHLVKTTRYFFLLSLLVSAVGWSVSAKATQGDVFAKGTEYRAATYDATNPDPNVKSDHPSYYEHNYKMPVDINVSSINGTPIYDDNNTPLYAPEDGTIKRIYNRHYRDSLTVTGVQGLNLSLKLCSPQHVSITVSRNPFFQFLI